MISPFMALSVLNDHFTGYAPLNVHVAKGVFFSSNRVTSIDLGVTLNAFVMEFMLLVHHL